MRKRKWQTVFYIFLIFALFQFDLLANQLYFTSEEVFYACERGLRSGPSEEIILEFDTEDGTKVLVGKQKDGLFVVPVEKTRFFLWRMKSGGIDGFFECDAPLNGYHTYDGNYLGLCLDEKITEFSILAGNYEERRWEELVYPVEGELIFVDAELDWDKKYVVYTEGRDAVGNTIFKDGDEELMKVIRNGTYTYGEIEVTNTFVSAADIQ